MTELAKVDPTVALKVANSIWVGKGGALLPRSEFVRRVGEDYRATVGNVIGAPGTINAWVRKATNDKIDLIVSDIDGDGRPEFVFGTSHGFLYALADAGERARVVWKAHLPASVGTPVLADVDNDGTSEILVGLGDGRLCLLR